MPPTRSWNSSLYIVTWNVASKYPDSICLHSLLNLDANPVHDGNHPDFYIIGLQEVNAQPQNVVMGLFKNDPWTEKFKEMLKIRDYVQIKSEQMQGLLIMMFAKRKHLLHVREVEAEYTRTGLGGIWGNKGAVSIRFSYYGCSMCVINSHLAAHDHMLEERINDYQKIVEEHKYHVKTTTDIFGHDYVFWFGDLNFRLMGEATTSPQDIRSMIEKDCLSELLANDQLTLVRNQGRAFHHLNERLPAFPPTFKFEQGTHDYNMKRRPAWCDRVLHRVTDQKYSNTKLMAEQRSYKSHPNYIMSDHKPVSSEFVITVEKSKVIRPRAAAYTHYDHLDNNSELKQTVDDPYEECVEFAPIHIWYTGEENLVEYILPDDFEEASSDWIGIFKEDYSGLDDYIAYEYTAGSKDSNPKLNQPSRPRTIQIEFPETIDLPEEERYVLIYFQSTGTRGVTGMVGISNSFKAEKRCPSPRFDTVD